MKIVQLTIVASFVGLVVSFWNRNDVPAGVTPAAGLLDEPAQTAVRKPPFDVTYNGIRYTVEPQYDYELRGMVVSYRYHEGNSRMHRRSNDYLNMLDVCLVWGANATSPLLDRIEFWNGIFTCNFETRDDEAFRSFNFHQLSNNHLISDVEQIRNSVRGLGVGDQIRVKGYLASYTNEHGARRGTSTIRTDTGNGACETIYVEEFEVLDDHTGGWRLAMYASGAVLALSLLGYILAPHRAR